MKQQTIKRIFTALFILSFLLSFLSTTFASSSDPFDFTSYDSTTGNSDADKIAQTTMGTAINIIRIVATGTAIIMLSYMGIKYITAAPNEKAEFKKSATGLIVGAVVLFATSGILGILADFASQIGS